MRAYRERLKAKEENFNVYKAKDNERKKVERKSNLSVFSPSEVARLKMLNRESDATGKRRKKNL